jgi:hypothetical protein
MRNFLLVLLTATLPVPMAAADPTGHQKTDPAGISSRLLPIKGNSAHNPCAAYGPGFAKVDGSDTCLKIGGAISVGVGGAVGSR